MATGEIENPGEELDIADMAESGEVESEGGMAADGEKAPGKDYGNKAVVLLTVTIVIFSAIIRFYQIHRFPVNIGAFEGIAGHAAIMIAEGDAEASRAAWTRAQQRPFGSIGIAWNPFLVYPMAVVYRLVGFDLSHIGIRIIPIIYGVLSVALIYLLMASMFDPVIGLVSAFFLATASWFITLSRVCNDFSATIFFSLLCFWIYSRAGRNIFKFILLGGVMALAPYFYLPARIVPIIVIFSILLRCIFERGYFKAAWLSLALMALSFQLVCKAQGIDAVRLYTGLAQTRGNELSWNRPEFSETLERHISSTYNRFFNSWGWAGISELAYERDDVALDPISRWLVKVGLLLSLLRIKKHKYRFLIIWLFGALLPLILTYMRLKRSLLVIPAFSALAAVGLCGVVEMITRWASGYNKEPGKFVKAIGYILILGVLLPVGVANLNNYFGEYRKRESSLLARRDRWPSCESKLQVLKEKDLYTDCWLGESYRTGQYLAYCVGKGNRLYQFPPDEARKHFQKSEGPAVLYLKSGEREEK